MFKPAIKRARPDMQRLLHKRLEDMAVQMRFMEDEATDLSLDCQVHTMAERALGSEGGCDWAPFRELHRWREQGTILATPTNVLTRHALCDCVRGRCLPQVVLTPPVRRHSQGERGAHIDPEQQLWEGTLHFRDSWDDSRGGNMQGTPRLQPRSI